MNFDFTEEQKLLADSVRGFAQAHLAKDTLARAHNPRCISATRSMTESSKLPSLRRRARRTAGSVLPLSPNIRSKTTRGLFSMGSGVDSLLHAIVLVYAQLYPVSQLPASVGSSSPISSEAS